MLSLDQQVALIRRHQRVLARLCDRTAATLAREWEALGSWDDDDVDRFAATIAGPELAATQAAVDASVGFYATLTSSETAAVPVGDVAAVSDPRRPFLATWHALAQGRPVAEALTAGRSTIESDAWYLVQSTARRTGDAALASQSVVGWRRVLTGASCEWCATVAARRYTSSEAADFGHKRCDCTAVPIIGDADPGETINQPLYDRLRSTPQGERTGFVDATGAPVARP